MAIGVVIGGVVSFGASWWCSRLYYRKAGNELRDEAGRLRLLHELTIYCLTNPDAKLTAKRNEKGEIVGVISEGTARARGSSSATFKPPN